MDAQPQPPTGRRYFVKVSAPSRNAMGELARRGLDLFAATAVATEDGAAIDGYLSIEAIADLADSGHTVTVHLLGLGPQVLEALADERVVRAKAARALNRPADQAPDGADPILDAETIAELSSVAEYIGKAVPAAQEPLRALTAMAEAATGKQLSAALRG